MLHLVYGRKNTDRDGWLLDRMIREPVEHRRYLIVPESISHEMERRLCLRGGDRISLWGEVLPLSRMLTRVLDEFGGGAQPVLDAGGRMLVLAKALKEFSPALSVYARPSSKPAFLKRMLETIDELKSCGVSPLELEKAGESHEKIKDLAVIYGAYQAVAARKGLDSRDQLSRLAHLLSQTGWAREKEFYIMGFSDFTAQEREVLSVLIEEGSEVTVSLLCDHADGTDELFASGRQTLHRLRKLAEQAGAEVREYGAPPLAREEELTHLERELFSDRPRPWGGAPGRIALYRAETPRSEVEWAAAELRRAIVEENLRYRDIVVAARSFEPYRALVESIFPQYGLKVFTSAMTDILEKPVLAVVGGALDLLESDWNTEEVFRYLKTGLAGLDPDEVDRLENYAETWSIRGSGWTGSAAWVWRPDGQFAACDAEDPELENLNELRCRVTQPLLRLKEQAGKTGRDCCTALFGFLEEIELPQRLHDRCQTLMEHGQHQQAEEYRQLWDILCTALDQCVDVLGEETMELTEFGQMLKLVLSQYDVGSIPVTLDQITAGEMLRVSNRECRLLCVLGGDDGQIPQVTASAGLLTEEDRKLLLEQGVELNPWGEKKLHQEWSILYECSTAPSERLMVFYPGQDADGREKRPSVLVSRLKAAFPKLETHLEGEIPFALTAPEPALQSGQEAVWPALSRVEGYEKRVEELKAARNLTRGKLSPGAVEALYGKRIPMSASRLDKVKSCHFSYFMQYGLEAKPRKRAGFAAPEYGTFVHYVMEHVLQERGQELPASERKKRVEAIVERYVQEELGGLEHQSPRFRYLFRRLEKTVLAVVENAVGELSRSEFKPVAFELGFGSGKDLPPITFTADGVTVSLSGFVDRVDGWEKDGRLYLRVVDYKTGRKSFDWSDVFHGMGLQMLVYLNALQEKGEPLFGKEILPAGVLYFLARDVVLRGNPNLSDTAIAEALDKELERKGVILHDPEVLEAMEKPDEAGYRYLPLKVSSKTGEISGDALVSAERLGKLQRHVEEVLTQLTREMAEGTITADPFWRGAQKNACMYCEFAQACQFREGVGGDRRRNMKAMRQKEFWKAMEHGGEEEVKEDGLSADTGTTTGGGTPGQ